MFRANNFDKLLDKATSNLRLDPDWPTIIQICDLIRQNDCSAKYAVAAIKKKLYSQNPHQAMFALLTLESVVKNCGSGVHDEVASKAFCESLRDLVKSTQHENLKKKTLELIQAWAFAFRNSPKYRAVQDTVNILKAEGFKFPALKESDAMFSADTAPEWADGEVCHRCRVAFSLMVRRHHCRACGQVFCQQCSSKTSTLPKFGIEKEVRVCDSCFDKTSRPPSSSAKLEIVDTASDYGPTQPQKRPPGTKTAEELQEEEELQLALALSQSEAEAKQKEKERKSRTHAPPDATLNRPKLSPSTSVVSSASPEPGANAELSRYLDRSYWEQRLPTAPASQPTPPHSDPGQEYASPVVGHPSGHGSTKTEDDAEDKEIDEFVDTLKSQLEIFVNRMKSNSSRGRAIANDTSVQTLFMNITAMHSRLLRYIQQQDDKRVYLESLQDKISQVRDSRAALDTLRAEHAARLMQAAEAAERQRQLQMAAKLHAMRKKKHEYLQYQRQLALQRVQEQEREMQMRQEQQKHQYMMAAAGYYMPPYQPNYHQQAPPNVSQGAAAYPMATQPTLSRPNVSQQQMMMQQMRLPTQAGHHQMMPQTTLPGQPMQNGNTLPKQTLSQLMSIGQTGLPGQMSYTNPMLGLSPNMRLPMMQQLNSLPTYAFSGQSSQLPMQNQLPGQQIPNQFPGQSNMMGVPTTQGQQVPLTMQSQHMALGQTMSLPAQGIVSQMTPGQPTSQNQNIPQQSLNNQQISQSLPGQQGPQMMSPGAMQQKQQTQNPQMPQQLAQNPQIPQQLLQNPQMTQQMPPQNPQMPQNHQMTQQMPPQNPQMPQNHQMTQQMPPQNPQMSQNHQMSQHMPQNPHMPQQLAQNPQMSQQLPPNAQVSQQLPHNCQLPQQQILPNSQLQQQPGVQGQQIPPQSNPQNLPQQYLAQGQPASHNQQMPPQAHPMQLPNQPNLSQGQQMPPAPQQGQPQMVQGQSMKAPSQNFTNGPPAPPVGPAQNAKSENNNSELISFD